ncbi:MAG: T9SS type A sorting domain-containing protein [Saprospiraceae bacterium]|nr:T9SS type A sorting domain-containing protein [Saprospiraceae bacterium]
MFGYNSDLGDYDEDFYKLELPVCGVVRVKISGLAASQSIRLYAYNKDQIQIGYVSSPSNGTGFTYDLLLPDSTSYLRIYDGNNKSDTTHLNMTLTYDVTDACECNNSFAKACVISPNTSLYPQMFGFNSDLGGYDEDFYKLDLPVCGVVRVKISGLAASQSIRLYAYNKDQIQIGYVSSPSNGTGFTYDLLLPDSTTYLRLYDGNNKSDTTHLNMTLTYDVTDACECNNSFAKACPVSPNTTLHPQMFGFNSDLAGYDEDFYKLNLSDCGLLSVNLSNLASSQSLRLYVYDKNQTQIGYKSSPSSGTGFTYDLALPDSTTYLRIYDGNNKSDTTHLNMKLTFSPCSATNETDVLDFKIYPNPVQGEKLFVQLGTYYGDLSVRLWNVHGQLVQNAEYPNTSGHIEFPIAAGGSGIFWLELKTSFGLVKKKVFKI